MTVLDTKHLHQLMAYEASRTAPPHKFPALPPISAARYTSPEFLSLEKEHLFGKTWLLAAHLDEIPEPGCFQRWDITGIPVIIVHTPDGKIRALLNRCSHRGAPVVIKQTGKRSRFICPYHGWNYGNDGELLAVTSERDFDNLDKSCLGLKQLRCETLGKLIFVNFDQHAQDLQQSLGSLVDEWAEFDLDNCRLARRDRFVVHCNWKIAMEANLEVYHVPMIHGDTIAAMLDSKRNVNTFYPGGHGRMIAPKPSAYSGKEWRSSWPEIATVSEIPRTCTLSYNVFPNLVMPLNQFVVPPIQFWPNGIDQCIVETWTMGADWGEENPKGPDMWTEDEGHRPNQILREDFDLAEAIQSALHSKGDSQIRLSYQEARIYYWHQYADTLIGSANIPEPLHVPPVISSQWVHPNEPRTTEAPIIDP